MIEPYQAVVVQASIREPEGPDDFRQTVRENIWRQIVLFRRFKFSYGRVRLVLVTEHCMHGLDASGRRERVLGMSLPMPADRPLWDVPGAEEMAMYALAAHEYNVYIGGSGWEVDPHWPDLSFHTGFIISPEGKIILKQRMINSGLGAAGTSGMYSRILETYGDDSPFGAFSVVDTDIGRIGICVGGDLIQFESTRTLAQRGAEIILQPMGERNLENAVPMGAYKRLAAFHNRCYLLSANIGQYQHRYYREPAPSNEDLRTRLPDVFAWAEYEFMGRSQIIAPDGQFLAYIPAAGESASGAVIDIERLRADRLSASYRPVLHGEAYAREYERFSGAPIDWEGGEISRFERTKATVARLMDTGTLKRSEAYGGEIGGGHFGELAALTPAKATGSAAELPRRRSR